MKCVKGEQDLMCMKKYFVLDDIGTHIEIILVKCKRCNKSIMGFRTQL